MHIAFLTPEYPHEKVKNAAGIGTSIKNLAEALKNAGVSVSIFVYSQGDSDIITENGIQIHLIKHKKFKLFSWFFYRKHIQNYLNKYIVLDEIDLVEAPDWTGITAFTNFKVPLIIRLHGTDAYFCHLEKRKQKIKNYWFEKLGIQKAKAIVAPTKFAATITESLFSITKEIKIIPNGLLLSDFSNENPNEFENGLILYIGTLIRKKGVFELTEIMRKVIEKRPNAKLILIGSDSFDIETQSQSTWELMQKTMPENVKKSIQYLGKIPYSSVRDYLKKANVCVFPSFAETQGMVTIEAMAMQKAVVNSNIGWANEILIDEKSGFLVDPKNSDLFSLRILSLLEDKELVENIGFEARKRVETIFDIDKIVRQNMDFYKSQL